MPFTHDTDQALLAAVMLVNTAGDPDLLTTVEHLDAWYEAFSYTGDRRGDLAELEEVRAFRPTLRELLTTHRDHAVELVNGLLADAEAMPQLVRHEPFDWHLHAVSPGASLVTRIGVETAMAMVDVIRTDELSRLSLCADHDCVGVVLDLSRNRSRRYCSIACGNRNSVAAYRARQAAASS